MRILACWIIYLCYNGSGAKETYCKMDKRAKDKLLGHLERMDLHSRIGRDEKKGKTQERTERGSRKRSSSAGSEKMERVGGR